jgi:hypothetical protein
MYDPAERVEYHRYRLVSVRDRSHAGEIAVFAAHEFYRPHESVAAAIENVASLNVHPDDPFAVDRHYAGVNSAGVH